jgi:hypothetical protein
MTHVSNPPCFGQPFEQHRVMHHQLQGSNQACSASLPATTAGIWGAGLACPAKHCYEACLGDSRAAGNFAAPLSTTVVLHVSLCVWTRA